MSLALCDGSLSTLLFGGGMGLCDGQVTPKNKARAEDDPRTALLDHLLLGADKVAKFM